MSNGMNSGYGGTNASMDPAGRSPEEIQQDIRQTRSQMDDTLDAIQRRLSPSNLMDEALNYLRHGGGTEFTHNFNESVKRNPVPTALVGIGLAWLMMSGKEGRYAPDRADSSHLGERMSGMASSLSSAMSAGRDKLADAKDSLSSASSQVRNRISQSSDRASGSASQASSQLRDQADSWRDSTRHQVNRMSDTARYSAQRARSGFDTMLHEQPLLLGALGIAVGAALGSMLPSTRQEDELMGEAHDRMASEVKQQAHLQLRKGKRVAQAAGEAASDAAQDEVERHQHQTSNDQQQAASSTGQKPQSGVQPTPGL